MLPIMPMILPIKAGRGAADGVGMSGSIRPRGLASWELRVYSGTNPDTGKRRYRTATVVGNRSDAEPRTCRARGIGSIGTVGWL